jgi:glyoxylase-like metal-dependent hydrolase (beta-lactamase superfamily II)
MRFVSCAVDRMLTLFGPLVPCRTDFMGGDSAALVRSIQQKLYTLPGSTRVIPGHGSTTDIEFEAKYNGVVKAAGKGSAL